VPLGSFEPLPFRHGCAATLSPFHGDSFWLVLPPACPERGFEPSAPGGRCSEGRIGRNREYCKRQRSKTTIFQPAFVAANVMSSRKGNGTESLQAVLLFPLSLTSFDSSPASGGAFNSLSLAFDSPAPSKREPFGLCPNSYVKSPSLRFGVERVLWTSKRNGERAGTGRITNGSE